MEYGPDHNEEVLPNVLIKRRSTNLIVSGPRWLGHVLEKFGIYGKTHFNLQHICVCVHMYMLVCVTACICMGTFPGLQYDLATFPMLQYA